MNSAMHLVRAVGRSMSRVTPVAAGPPGLPTTSSPSPCRSGGPIVQSENGTRRSSLRHTLRRDKPTMKMYQLTDRLHAEHTVLVPGHEIAATVSAWLAQLDAASPFVDELAQAAEAGDWPTTYTIGEKLSVEVAVAAWPIR